MINQSRSPLQIGDIARADFRTSFAADAENSRIQKVLELPYRYQPARLAISLSLRDAKALKPLGDAGGRPIKGDTLFGQDEADLTLWVALIVEHTAIEGLARRDFQDLVAAHWARGIVRLTEATAGASRIEVAFARLVSVGASH
ncbi:hypothetical protein [Mesorhizobium sp. M0053]|uniref:hypothetical protein n=1 Tax=Mesorhizobium sp. M0053 TaxID=2956864 RepID=UPI00333D6664